MITIPVAAPARRPRRGGIKSVVGAFVDTGRLSATDRIGWESSGCNWPAATRAGCFDVTIPSAEKETVGVDQFDAIGPIFAQVAGVQCFIGGDDIGATFLEQATGVLSNGEDRMIEEKLLEWGIGGTAITDATSYAAGIGGLENLADQTYTGLPVLVMSRLAAAIAFAEGALTVENDVLVSGNGTPVLAVGVEDDQNQVTIIGWPAVYASPAISFAAVDHRTNQEMALAERLYAIGVDCDFRATVEVNISAGGGGEVDPATLQRITDLETAVAGKANTAHVHAGADITSGTVPIARIPTGTTASTVALGNHTHTAAAVGAAATAHTHSVANVTGLQAELDSKVETVGAGTGIAVNATDPQNPIVSAV